MHATPLSRGETRLTDFPSPPHSELVSWVDLKHGVLDHTGKRLKLGARRYLIHAPSHPKPARVSVGTEAPPTICKKSGYPSRIGSCSALTHQPHRLSCSAKRSPVLGCGFRRISVSVRLSGGDSPSRRNFGHCEIGTGNMESSVLLLCAWRIASRISGCRPFRASPTTGSCRRRRLPVRWTGNSFASATSNHIK